MENRSKSNSGFSLRTVLLFFLIAATIICGLWGCQPAEADPEPDLTEPETTQNPEIPSARFGELHVISEEDLPADKDRDFWLYGFQEKTESGSMTLRVVSLYGTDEYDTAGIKVSFAAGGPSDEQETQGELVSEINSGNGSLSATKLGGARFLCHRASRTPC